MVCQLKSLIWLKKTEKGTPQSHGNNFGKQPFLKETKILVPFFISKIQKCNDHTKSGIILSFQIVWNIIILEGLLMSEISSKPDQIKPHQKSFKKELRKQTVGYIVAALALVAGLAWNEAIKALLEYLFPIGQNSLMAKLFYAVIMTIIVVFGVYILNLVQGKDEKEE